MSAEGIPVTVRGGMDPATKTVLIQVLSGERVLHTVRISPESAERLCDDLAMFAAIAREEAQAQSAGGRS